MGKIEFISGSILEALSEHRRPLEVHCITDADIIKYFVYSNQTLIKKLCIRKENVYLFQLNTFRRQRITLPLVYI